MPLNVTVVRMVVSMKNNSVKLQSFESGAEPTADPYSTVACNVNIPWCDNVAQFAEHHLTLSLGPNFPPIAIWQSGNYVFWSANNQWPASGKLGGDYVGHPYAVNGGRDVVLVVDNRPWPVAILYALS